MKIKMNINKYLKLFLILSVSFYIFSVCSFGERPTYHLINYAALFIIFCIVVIYVLRNKKIYYSKYFIYMPFFSIYSLIITVLTTRKFDMCITSILLSASFVLLLESFSIINNDKWSKYSMVLGLSAFGIYYFIIYFEQILSFDFTNRLGHYFGNENSCGIALLFSAILCLDFIIRKKKYWFIPLFLIMDVLAISTGSKKVFLSLLIIFIVYIYFLFKKRKVFFYLGIIAIVGIFIGILQIPALESIKTRFLDMFLSFFNPSYDASTSIRFEFLNASIWLGLKNFVLGNGSNAFEIILNYGTYSHTNFGEIFCDFGFIGLVLFYMPLIIPFFYKNKQKDLVFSKALIILYLFLSFAMIYFTDKLFYIFYSYIIYNCYGQFKNGTFQEFKNDLYTYVFNITIKQHQIIHI